MKTKQIKKPSANAVTAILIGVTITLLLIVFAAALIAWLVINELLGISSISAISKMLLFVCVLFGAVITLTIKPNRKLWHMGMYSSVIIILQLFLCLFNYNGISGKVLINIMITIGATALALLIMRSRKKRKQIFKKRFC